MMRRLLSQRTVASFLAAAAAARPVALPRRAMATSDSALPERFLLYENDSFLSGTSAHYVDSMYQAWREDPASVDESWASIFERGNLADREEPILESPIRVLPVASSDMEVVRQSLDDCGRLTWMIQAFEGRGHLLAHTDPLNLDDVDLTQRTPSRRFKDMVRLDLAYFGFSSEDANRVVRVGFQDTVGGVLNTDSPPMTISQLHQLLLHRYCGKIGYELSHVADSAARRFIRTQIELEDPNSTLHRPLPKEEKLFLWDIVASAVHFEDFFKRKYSTQKRFGCDGAESLIVGLRALMEASSKLGVEKINLGMAHRGRLNVLYHIIGKPFEVILKEFVGVKGSELAPFQMQSDVKYHLGSRSQVKMQNGNMMQTEMLCNPSHLEAVNPFVQGYSRADQDSRGEGGALKVLPIEIHGDAAFSGQGVAFESMLLSEVKSHGTGGTIHVVCNNQIGFTTDPKCSRSSAYCTDLGRVYGCPIIHVNGDSPEDVARVFSFAAEYRAHFHKSVVIDLVCYRTYGHNENDDPSITQPLMYQRIRSMPSVFRKYSDQLLAEGVITGPEVTTKSISEKARFGAYQDAVDQVNYASYLRSIIPDNWKTLKYSDELGQVTLQPTTITPQQVEQVARALETYPENFEVNSKLKVVLERRVASLRKGTDIDWGAAEALAFGAMLLEGHNVRIMGEDVERGTYSHRHAVVHNVKEKGTYVPLAHLAETQGRMHITNDPLSEYGGLGYASGYSLFDPKDFVMWEAQYGDFANEAAIVFDQFLSAGETKWNQQQSCVVSLPHGFDGKGPEHSSGRLERFLQMSSEDELTPAYSVEERAHRVNWEIVQPSTPAQYFHVLRRHLKRDFRKALVIFFSKQFLRAPNVSAIESFTSGAFQPVIEDPAVPASQARRLVLCSGQLYHSLCKYREAHKIGADVALVRLEELSPFPVAEVQRLLADYAGAELVWAQEEPKNMGAWEHVEPRIEIYTKGERPLRYIGRRTNSAVCTGYAHVHKQEQEALCAEVFAP
ncbi:2-oxoglutarate dehydrogenase E1 component [Strigomonas culicis]|uniref:oxoglutarate dehydrogenase (succinyl-transferring) n=2 Tax=Strigomonas culicis TaxID=28005 RepID=S9UY44_9TRYP|nr:2-oxoglutarate dehydrogenase E1 component [Strigomonas culicis]EPY19802.1 2-oxoglutarate dehydrogenase E1 component [Strigomonas culicis]|eukprot:EPY19506.1 2-oxoglutarate dehydrogenase E1 component [Strigomonas culicis]